MLARDSIAPLNRNLPIRLVTAPGVKNIENVKQP